MQTSPTEESRKSLKSKQQQKKISSMRLDDTKSFNEASSFSSWRKQHNTTEELSFFHCNPKLTELWLSKKFIVCFNLASRRLSLNVQRNEVTCVFCGRLTRIFFSCIPGAFANSLTHAQSSLLMLMWGVRWKFFMSFLGDFSATSGTSARVMMLRSSFQALSHSPTDWHCRLLLPSQRSWFITWNMKFICCLPYHLQSSNTCDEKKHIESSR